MLRRDQLLSLLATVLSLAALGQPHAVGQSTNTYQGNVGPPDNLWSDEGNWNLGVAPDETHHVVIPYAATTVMDLPYTSDFGTKILSLSVAGGGTVDLEL